MPRIIEPLPAKSNSEPSRRKRTPFVLAYVGLVLLVLAFTIDASVDSGSPRTGRELAWYRQSLQPLLCMAVADGNGAARARDRMANSATRNHARDLCNDGGVVNCRPLRGFPPRRDWPDSTLFQRCAAGVLWDSRWLALADHEARLQFVPFRPYGGDHRFRRSADRYGVGAWFSSSCRESRRSAQRESTSGRITFWM